MIARWTERYGAPSTGLVAAGILCAAVAWFFWDAFLLRGAFFVQDVMVQNVPFRHHLHEALAQGRLPVWVPEINAGFPLLAEGQVGALYPPNILLAFLLSPWQAVNWSVILHLMLAAVTMVALLRRWQVGLAGCITGGLTYGLSGYLVVRAMSPNYLAVAAWLPLLFCLIDTALTTGRRRPLVWAALVVSLQLLAGHPQATAYGVAAVALFSALRTRRGGLPTRVAWVGFGAAGGGLWLAAAQILPTLELTTRSARSDGLSYERFVQMSMAPERLVTLLLPSLLGNSASGTYWGDKADFFIQMCPYLGVLALPMIALALFERRNAVTFALGVTGVIGLVLSMGKYTGLFEALYGLPGMSHFRIPTRFLLWWALAGAALTGIGVDHLVRGPVRRRQWLVGATLIGLCLALAAPLLWKMPAIAVSDTTSRALIWRTELLSELVRGGLILSVVMLLVGTNGWRRSPVGRGAVAIIMPLIVLADLSGFGRNFNPLIDAAAYEQRPLTAMAILQDAQGGETHAGGSAAADSATRAAAGNETGAHMLPLESETANRDLRPAANFRIASLVTEAGLGVDWHGGWRWNAADYRLYPETLRLYTGGMYGLANTMPGWSPLHLSRHWDLAAGYPSMLPLASVDYVIVSPGRRQAAGSGTASDLQLPEASPVAIRRLAGLPRAYVVGESVILPEAEDRLRALWDRFDPHRHVLLEAGEPLRAGAHASRSGHFRSLQEAAITLYDPTRVLIDLPPRDQPGYLVLTDTDYPGWQAWVDDAPVAIETANHVFRAVRIEPSNRRVRFEYHPTSVRYGAWLSLAGLVLWGGLLWQARRHDQRMDPVQIEPEEPPIISSAWLLQGGLILVLYGLATHTSQWLAWQERIDLRNLVGF
ncbi:MAG: YfhO family protein [Gemmatimonadetes bacterium]|jgi:hypothetical protein|nr:YfhO family protein [Gemmatimonadota bacterium]MBT6143960.1 YfhO family protein [Gemmatimonadota bacterium]MBT7863341.1 YfhO family protein [Gemmatimonadota bacterium]